MKRIYRLMILSALFCISCVQSRDPVDYVNPAMGGISHLLVPTYPMVHRPNSMLRMTPVRQEYTSTRMSALSLFVHSHRNAQSFTLSPCSCEEQLDCKMSYSYDLEKLTPYSYDVYLEEPQVMASFSPAERSAIWSLHWRSEGERWVVVGAHQGEFSYADGALSGWMPLKGQTKAYIHLVPSAQPVQTRSLSDGRMALCFDSSDVELRYGVSFIDTAQAADNMSRELSGNSLEDLVAQGRRVWNETLSKIKVTGGSDDEKSVFYTSMYRISERQVNISEYGRHWSAFDSKVHDDSGRPYYTDDWYWDTYRAVHPLRTIIDPKMEMDIVNSSILAASRSENGWLPMFPTVTGDTHSMNANHGVAVIADCLAKGLDDFDTSLAWQVSLNALQTKSLAPWSYSKAGRLDDFYKENGWYPALAPGQQETEPEVDGFERRQPVAVTLGTVYDEWCLSRIAEALSMDEEKEYFRNRSLNYRKIFNEKTGFFHPKTADGDFIEPFDYQLSGGLGFRNAYDENNGWIYRWDVPHNVADLVALMGGEEAFVGNLDEMFQTPVTMSKYDFWSKGPDHGALTGQFSMANEPCMHIPYLYNYAGSPWKTQKMTRKLLDLWFRNDLMGVPGDEDGGGLSSFAVFSMMGFYPVTPGLPVYALTSPVFESVELALPEGKTFKVECRNYSPDNRYIQSATLNSEPWDKSWIAHEDIVAGGVLCLEMGRFPNKEWAASSESCPPSFEMTINPLKQ